MAPIMYNIFGIPIGLAFLIVLVTSGIILIKEKNILKPDRRKFSLFLMLFILFSYLPIQWCSFKGNFSLLGIIKNLLGPDKDFLDFASLIISLPFLIIISYLFSCLIVFVYDKFRTKKIIIKDKKKISSAMEIHIFTKTKILIGILIGIILVGGWWIWNSKKIEKSLPTITYEKIITCNNNSDCYCCDSLGLGKQHPLTLAYEEAYANVCINKNYLDKGYRVECQHNIEDEKTFCGTHQCKCENNRCISALKSSFTEKIIVNTDDVGVDVGEIANWKIYRDEEYGFDVKYPKSWYLTEACFPYCDSDDEEDKYEKIGEKYYYVPGSIRKNWILFYDPIFHDEGIDACGMVVGGRGWEGVRPFSVSELLIIKSDKSIGKDWEKYSIPGFFKSDKKPGEFYETNDNLTIFYEKDSLLYIWHMGGLEIFPKHREIFKQMLSTFRFLE